MLCTKYFVFNYFVFVLNDNMGYLIPLKLVQQCMKQLGGLYIYMCVFGSVSEKTKIGYIYKMGQFPRKLPHG